MLHSVNVPPRQEVNSVNIPPRRGVKTVKTPVTSAQSVNSVNTPARRGVNSVDPLTRRHLIKGLIKIDNNIKCLTFGVHVV